MICVIGEIPHGSRKGVQNVTAHGAAVPVHADGTLYVTAAGATAV